MQKVLNEKFSLVLIASGLLIILIAIFLFLYKANILNFNAPIDGSLFGQFGDVVGGVVGSLWALAGVVLFYAGLTEQRKAIELNENALMKQIDALTVQKEEMQLLREEYAMARNVFEQQKDVSKEQVKTSTIQQFESNFYSLINIYTHITDQLFGDNGTLIGISNDIRASYYASAAEDLTFRERRNLIDNTYIEVYQKNGNLIAHYLKTVYRIFKVIEERIGFSDKEKYFYAKVVRSQFTDDELFIIFYNASSSYGRNFRTLILKYNLLKHFNFLQKLEAFTYLNEDSKCNYLKEHFCDILSGSLQYFCGLVNDLSNPEPTHHSMAKIGSHDINVDFSTTLDEHIVIEISNCSGIAQIFEFTSDKLSDFFADFVLDLMITSNFEQLSGSDFVNVYINDNDYLRLEVITDKKPQIVQDLY